jgi:hypothetical protein
MVGPIKMSAEPHVYEKQHFAASRREKSRTVEHAPVEPCSTVALFTLVNFFFFFYEKHGEKFSFFFLEKPVQLIAFTRIVHVNMNNIVF